MNQKKLKRRQEREAAEAVTKAENEGRRKALEEMKAAPIGCRIRLAIQILKGAQRR